MSLETNTDTTTRQKTKKNPKNREEGKKFAQQIAWKKRGKK